MLVSICDFLLILPSGYTVKSSYTFLHITEVIKKEHSLEKTTNIPFCLSSITLTLYIINCKYTL